jgi:amino acid adenylation domain-containing protein
MKPINAFLAELLDLGIDLWVEGDRLRYKAQEGALTPELRAEIAARKAEIITDLKQSDRDSNISSERISSQRILPISRDQNLPLSFGQQRLWFVNQLDKNSAVYNESISLKIEGKLQIPTLEEVIQTIWQRHELLRTSFSIVDESPVQIIHPPQNLPLQIIDLQTLPTEEQWSRVEQLVNHQDQQPFNLECDRLLRLALIKLADNCHILSLTIHHIIADGSFISIFIQDFTALYAAFLQGSPSPLPELSIQYADYAYWQHQRLQGELLKHHINYWKQQLADAPTYLELPTDRLRPPIQTFQGRGEQIQISSLLTQKLKQLSQQSGVTLFMTLLAAFTVLLSRHTNQKDIVIGSPISNRNSTQLEGLLGFFVNNLILRIQIQQNLSFTDLLSQVRQVSLDAFEHSEAPFEKIVDEIQLERNLSYHPLFQVAFVLQNTPMWKLFQNSPDGKLEIAGLTLKLLSFEQFKAKFDLTLEIVELDQKLTGAFIYNTDLFEAETIKRMIKHFHILLESVVSDPQQIISQLPLMPEEELHQILVEWNATQTDYPHNYCIHHLFEQQVKRTPDSIAITFDNQTLTYHDLNSRANKLAHYLQGIGVEPETLVGICVERSLEMVIGLLGILKAGGTYVPIDPSYPLDRIEYMLSDSQAKILITQQSLTNQIPEYTGLIISLDSENHNLAQYSVHNPQIEIDTNQLAYVIYTSGSTGKPKGVQVMHKGVSNFLLSMQNTLILGQSDVLVAVTTICFDIAVLELYLPLLVGAKLAIASRDVARDAMQLQLLISSEQATCMQATPSTWRMLLEIDWQGGKNFKVLCGGENLPLSLATSLASHNGFVWNLYGPTEATVWATISQVKSEDRKVTIGSPLANTQLYVLDGELQPVPIGVAGELFIGGVQVARGYLNRPELTAERFICDPFSADPDARLYKTGDRVRYLTDGAIEYLGRIDFQVKLRGFRIELGEIEAILLQQSYIRQAVVLLYEESLDDKYLVAYIVPEQVNVDILELRRVLRHQLPEYMVPALFVELTSFPLTPNGKVDRRSLPAPTSFQPQSEHAIEDTRTPIEDVLVSIWSNVLGLKSIGLNDNFFEIGGHSLKVMQVMARVRDSFSIDLPLQTLFQEPTIAGLSREIESTYQTQQGYQIPPIIPTEHSFYAPVSFAQQRMWFLQQFEPNSATYNIPIVYRVSGLLEIASLEESLKALVKRHEILRTSFISANEQIVCAIAETISLAFTVVNLEPETTPESLQQLIDTEIRQPFNLSKPPLFRVKILELTECDRVLIINFHHIIADGWSINIFMQELAELYQSSLQNNPISLKDLSIRYVDFAVWQRQWLQGEVLRSLANYWQQQLAEPLPILSLPTDRPRPLIQTFHGATQALSLSADLTAQIKNLAQKTATTIFMILLAAFQILLARYSGQTDIIIGSPIAGRHQVATESLIGLFVNSLAIRIDLSGNPTVDELLEKVRAVTLAAYTHQDLPLEQLIEALQIKRELSYAPLFQAMFTLLNTPSQPAKFSDDLELTPLWSHTGTTKVDLTLGLQETGLEIEGVFEYNSDLFDTETIQRLIGHFQTLLAGIVSNPQQRIAELSILTAAEKQTILIEWSQTRTEYPRDKTIAQLFEAQVEQNPTAIAVVYEDKQITYQELNQKANQLAHHLHKLGVESNTFVGICIERSIEMIVGLVAILKAGAAYVPIEANYPLERIDYMLVDAQVKYLLTENSLDGKFSDSQTQVIYLEHEWETIAKESPENLPSNTTADNLAYIIYTSGSTGEPKGVVVPHRAVNRLVINTNYIKLSPSDRIAQASNVAFDAATFEIWGALLNGAELIGMTKEVMLSPQKLASQIRQQQITTLFLTTALFNQIAKQLPDAFSPLHNLLFGGEASDPKAVKEVLAQGAPDHLVHVYGPTENTTFSSWYLVESVDEWTTTIPIGKAIANSQMYILDLALNLVPIGVIGEIYVSGDGLAKGYLNRPELTTEKFINHSFSELESIKLYKTGDLGKYLPDGNIEILGRSDFQVKIRGFRIELGEIETALRQQEHVRETIVVAFDDDRGSKQLVAYVVSKIELLTSKELRSFLKEKLPDYMIPAFFVFLDKLPLTPNGKVDRRALPTPDLAIPSLESSFAPPSTPTENAIAAVWSEILKIEQVGIYDNFFELGGHSLIATQVMSRLPQMFSLDLPLSLLFELPTIAELADRIDTILWASGDSRRASLTPIQSVSRDQHLPLSFAQQRLWLIDQITANNSVYNVTLAYRMTGDLDIEMFSQSLNAIAQRHESLRTTFNIIDQQPVQSFVGNLEIDLPIIDLRSLTVNEQKQELGKISEIEAKTPFDLSQSPLLRAKLVRLAPDDHVFFLTMHHIICDGWSLDIFFRELGLIYEAFAIGKPSPLAPLVIHYADFALWQREWLQGEVLEAHLSYWKQQLSDINPLLQLATDRPRPTVQSYKGDRQILYLSKSLSDALKALSNSEGATLFMTLLAAFQTLLYRYTGQTDILVGCPIANRNRTEIENLIGFFVNTLALRADFADDLTFRELLNQTKKVTLEAYAHQDLPFEKLVEELNLERDLSFNPIVQVTFALQTASLLAITLSNLKLAPLEDNKNNITKFDLEVSVWETPEGLAVDWGYNSDLFTAATMQRMIQHYQILLEGIVSNHIQQVSELTMLTVNEEHQLLVEWQQTQTNYPRDKSIHQLFEEQVVAAPDAIAVIFGDRQLTYQELNQKANQLAHHLQKLGVTTNELVGICIERSIEMIVSLLAILKAGGAYVPLDPSYPQERLVFMVQDSQISRLLTQEHLSPNFSANPANELLNKPLTLICVDQDWETFNQYTSDNLNIPFTLDNLAYVEYTSGSTGIPKGVCVSHQGVVRLVKNTNYFNFHPNLVFLQLAPISFDASTFEIWGSLLNGAKLAIMPPHIPSLPELGQAIKQYEVTTLWLTSGLFNLMVDERIEDLQPLQHLLAGGDALSIPHVQKVLQQLPNCQLINGYGPTENTTFTCCYPITPQFPIENSVPIGRPIANTFVYILDRFLQPVPIGVSGELYIGGDGLAFGYLNNAQLTDEKFIPNPFARSSGDRLYKTGDLARYLADGNVEFLGRKDFQVKIRGFRIEISEIEVMISQYEHVQDVIVIAKDDPLGNKCLIAYVVAKFDTNITSNQLRSFLKEKLPDYMIPAAFVVLDRLPLTPNGKVDKKALPSSEDLRSQVADDYLKPQTEVERIIASVWQEILQIGNVGIYDNFFEIGGNSLLLVQAYSKFQNLFGSQVSMVMLFRYPNIHALAEHLSQNQPIEVSEPNRAETRKSRQDLMKQQRQNRLQSRLPNNSHDL